MPINEASPLRAEIRKVLDPLAKHLPLPLRIALASFLAGATEHQLTDAVNYLERLVVTLRQAQGVKLVEVGDRRASSQDPGMPARLDRRGTERTT